MASQTLQMPQTHQPHPVENGDQQQSSEDITQELSKSDSLPSYPGDTSAMKQYNMYYTASYTNVRLHLGSSSGPCVYYTHIKCLSNKPQIQLRYGDSKTSPMVAFAKIHLTSRHVLLGSGDYEKDPEETLVWEELHRGQNVFRRGDYEFSTSTSSGMRRKYQWRRDREKHGRTIYDCVDEEGQVVAYMLSGGMFNFRKGGEIKIAESVDKKLEELLIVSALSIWIWEAGGSFLQGY